MLVGYMRISTSEQNLALQRDVQAYRTACVILPGRGFGNVGTRRSPAGPGPADR
jgi:hypothetical protein